MKLEDWVFVSMWLVAMLTLLVATAVTWFKRGRWKCLDPDGVDEKHFKGFGEESDEPKEPTPPEIEERYESDVSD